MPKELGSVPSTVGAYFKDVRQWRMCVAPACYKKRSGDPWAAPCGSAGTAQQGIQVHNYTLRAVLIVLIGLIR
jgi:hypothetical protein